MIYLDNAATSFPKAPGVAEAVYRCLTENAANAGRGSHRLAQEASRLLFDTRDACAKFLDIRDAERLVFTKNATEALNLAILGSVPPEGTVVTSSLEHNSVMRPLRYLEAQRGVRLIIIPFDACGQPNKKKLREALETHPHLVVMTAASNVTGCLLPIEEIATLCRDAQVPLCIDGSQLIGHIPVSMEGLGASCFAFSGHKGLLGPMGTGGLYLAPGFEPEPLLRGGTGSLSESEFQPDILPDRYEAGTQNICGLAGLLASLRFLDRTGITNIQRREEALNDRLLSGLLDLPGVTSPGPRPGEKRAPVISICIAGRDLGEVALELDRSDIALRLGLHCSPSAHRSIETFESGGTLRFSPGYFNTEAEIDAVLATLEKILA